MSVTNVDSPQSTQRTLRVFMLLTTYKKSFFALFVPSRETTTSCQDAKDAEGYCVEKA
jgi:hypothetical protein